MFILTHGRPEKIYTLKTLKKVGYSGDLLFVVDDEDSCLGKYKELYGDKVCVFSKRVVEKTFDDAGSFGGDKYIVYARNYCYELAKKLGYKYFMELDDDYTEMSFKFNIDGEYKYKKIKDVDKILESLIVFYEKSGADIVAFAQGGDFIGGREGMGKDIRIKRKAMNTQLCCPERPIEFLGKHNEDVNTYVRWGQIGKLFFTINVIAVIPVKTQSNSGGMTSSYLETGTYVKSFYTVMFCPSCVKISRMGNKDRRIHHKINWSHAVPVIVSENYKKS
jgi:hypothetical protein